MLRYPDGIMTTPALVLEDITLSLDGTRLISTLSMTVAPGEIVTVMGPSGSGKSSLLNYIAGFLPDAFDATGRVLLGDTDLTRLPPEKRRTAMLFQESLLFPHMTVAENLAFGIPRGRSREQRKAAVQEALLQAELPDMGKRMPSTLSGGQQTRVALMRALLSEPRALLLDEPFSALDRPLRARLRSFVFRRIRESGLPTLVVTHDPEDADAAGGRVIQIGDSETAV